MTQNLTKRILIVDSDPMDAARERVILAKQGFEVVHAVNAEAAYEIAMRQPVHLVVTTIELPDSTGYALCQRIRHNPTTRGLPVLLLGAKGRSEDKNAASEAGADDYLIAPFPNEELVSRVKDLLARAPLPALSKVSRRGPGMTLAVFSAKGGVGKTMLAVNLAVGLRKRFNKRIALFDANFFFGDVNVHMNLPSTRTVLELVQSSDDSSPANLEQFLIAHPSGVRVLLSPYHPEEAELVTVKHVRSILELLSQSYDFVIVDCGTSYDDRTLAVLEYADQVLLVTTPEMGSVENSVLFFELAAKLEWPLDKIHLVLNRYNANVGIEPKDLERNLRRRVEFRLPSGGQPVAKSLNRGVPLILDKADHPLVRDVMKIVEGVSRFAYAAPDSLAAGDSR